MLCNKITQTARFQVLRVADMTLSTLLTTFPQHQGYYLV